MTYCPKCRGKVEEGSSFCQNCGAIVERKIASKAIPKKGLMRKIEQDIYFRITRVFAWLVAALATIGFIVSVIYVLKTAPQVLGGSAKVSQEEVRNAIAGKSSGGFQYEMESERKRISPELLAKLDKEIYELIYLLPKDTQSEWDVERLRGIIRNSVASWENIKDKLTVIQEARALLKNFSEEQRADAMYKFFVIKTEKENIIKVRKADALKNLGIWAGIMLAMIYTITMISMILVALAIEKNTRKVE
ncbi:MAG: zinc ribbon domain-containing protein [Nitrospirota bacterium]